MRIIVTGGNSGVGKETATALAAAGHSVLIAARDIAKSERVAAEIPGDVEVAHLDLADLTSVRKFADSVDTVDVLVNNAGVLGLPLTRTAGRLRNPHGHELPRPFRVDLPARRPDHGPGRLGHEHEPHVQPSCTSTT